VSDPVTRSVLVGLVIGKPLGIPGAAGLAVRVLHLLLPDGIGWRQVVGVGLLAGIGFTVSSFIAGLAFDSSDGEEAAKLGVLVASVLAGATGTSVPITHGDRVPPDEREPALGPVVRWELVALPDDLLLACHLQRRGGRFPRCTPSTGPGARDEGS
jgi:hypothetical protein